MKLATAQSVPVINRKGSHFFSAKNSLNHLKPKNTNFFPKNQPQKKELSVGRPGDTYEVEADAVADKVVQRLSQEKGNDAPFFKSEKPTPSIQRKCSECCGEEIQKKEEEPQEEVIQPKTSISASTAAEDESIQRKNNVSGIAQQLNSSKGTGNALPEKTKKSMETAFGTDFSKVHIHTGDNAVQMSEALHAQAFTHGNNIYFNKGKYNPESTSGAHLLAHELTHTIQQGAVPNVAPKIQKNEGGESASTQYPARSGISVGMTGVNVIAVAGATYHEGSKLDQAFHILVYRLIGPEYSRAYTEALLAIVRSQISGIGALRGNATEGEEITKFFVPLKILDQLIGKLRVDQHTVLLNQNQLDILRFGAFAVMAWKDYHIPEVARDIGVSLPKWYSQHLFIQEISQHIGLLRPYIDRLQIYHQERSNVNKQEVVSALADIIYAIEGEAALLEVIRTDQNLIAHSVYQMLWPTVHAANPEVASTQDTPEPQMAPEDRKPNPQIATSFFSFSRTQPDLSRNSFTKEEPRTELLDRFERFLVRGVTSATGDQQLSDTPGSANTAPHNARMSVSPSLSGPPGGLQLEASEAADYRFIMSILFPSVFDAFQRYYFEWNYVRVPDERLGSPVDYDELEKQEPSNWDVASNRFARAGKYAVEDVQTLFESLGPIGVGAVSLVAANAILRFIGTGIRLGFEILTMPDSEKLIQFPGPGVYMVRCKAIPDHSENAELVRPPSVAFQPVIVKDPLEMIRSRVDQQVLVNGASMERMHELREMLAEPVSYENGDELRKELDILERSLSSVGGSLEVQQQQLEDFINDPETAELEKKKAQKQLDNLIKIIQVRNDRSEDHDLTGAEPLIASFVSDTGQSIRLSLEAVDKFAAPIKEYWVSDLTTPNSSQATGYGTSREQAILNAVEKILEGSGGYGRGFVAVSIDGVTYNRRIASSLGNLFMEAVENVSTVLSLAAVVAAPFTGGASLGLLLPIGVVGAVPSAYRLINRAIDDTLRFDMAMVMDVINIAGGLVGLGHAAVPLRMIQTGKVLYVVGLGLDGLGVLMIPVGVVSQIMELEGLPPGEKAARIMEILGHAMLNVGIMAGGIAAARARQRGRNNSSGEPEAGADAGTRNIDLADLPEGRRALNDVKSDIIEINGERHQVSVSFKDGNLYIRICSDCGALIQRMYHILGDRSLPADLRTSVRELLNTTEALQADINLGRRDTESTEVQQDVDQIAQNLADIAGHHPTFIEPIVTPAVAGSVLTPLALNEFRARIEALGRRPGKNAESIRALEVLENEILPRTDLTDAERMMMIGSLIEGLRNNRAPTRSLDMVEVDMGDPSIIRLFEEAIAHPSVESVTAWHDYMDIVRSKYFGRSSLHLGRSPRRTDRQAVSGTDAMRAAFIDGMDTGTVLPEAAVAVRRHLSRAIESAGSAEAAVALHDAVWIDGQRGGRVDASHPNAVLWPADPVWGVWRVDHIVELQHGGADQPHNYVPAPQRMHGIKSDAMNHFGRSAVESSLIFE